MGIVLPEGDNQDAGDTGHSSDESWRKSSFSFSNGDCIEVASLANGRQVGVRDSRAIMGPQLRFLPCTWSSFLESIRLLQP
jgi:Domain of unknown function (DUF397)